MKFSGIIISALILGLVFSGCKSSKVEVKEENIEENKPLQTVQIGNQIWTAENLNIKTDSGSWCYNDDEFFANRYGRLYDWETAKKLCPEGFRLPTLEDWNALIDFYGAFDIVAPILKSTKYWSEQSQGNPDPNSLNALPGGLYNGDQNFFGEKFSAYYWTGSEANEPYAYYINLDYDKTEVLQDRQRKSYGFSVRYIKN